MSETYRVLLGFHVVVGTVVLATFWVAALSRKGGRLHRRCGKAFTTSMTATILTAVVLCLLLLVDPLAARPPGPDVPIAEHAPYAEILRHVGGGLLIVSLIASVFLYLGWSALRRREVSIVRHLVGMMGAGAIAHGSFSVNIARHFTDDVGLMFLPAGPTILAFAAVIAWNARRQWRSALAGGAAAAFSIRVSPRAEAA